MRIDYLSFSELPSRAANSVHVVKMARSLAAAGHGVRLHAWGDPASDDYAFYGVPRTFEIVKLSRPRRRGGGVLMARRAAAAARAGGLPDLFYGRHLASLLAVSRTGVPLVYEAHTPPAGRLQALGEGALFRSPAFARLVVITDALRAEYLRRFPGLDPARVLVAHDGADLPAGPAAEPEAGWPGRPGALQCGYVGHLYAGRGIEVLAALAERVPEADVHLVGGTDADLAAWKAKLSAPNLHLHGFVPHGRLRPYFDRFDVVLAPYQASGVSSTGGFGDTGRWMSPLKLFEYMAHAKAVVCSDVPVLREVLEPGRTALLVPPADLDGWAAAVRRLAADPGLRQSLGRAARADVEAHYTWDGRARRVVEGLEPRALRAA